MNQRSEEGLFEVLEKELRAADEPMDCNMLFDLASVRSHAASANRVSDYLGNLWRKGSVLRLPAPKGDNNKARWMYVWKDKGPKKTPKPDVSQAFAYDDKVNTILHKPNLTISEDGRRVLIDTPAMSIVIELKSEL